MSMPSGLSEREAATEIERFLDTALETDSDPGTLPHEKPAAGVKPAAAKPNSKPTDATLRPRSAAAPAEEDSAAGDEQETADDAAADDELEAAGEGEGEGDGQAAGEEPVIDSVEAIAEYFEVEPAAVYEAIEVEAPDGSKMPLAQALEAWRESESLLTHRRAEMEAEHAKIVEETNTAQERQLAQLYAATKNMVNVLREEYSDEKLQQARHEDADRYLALVERKAKIQAEIEGALRQFDEHSTKRQTQASEDVRKVLTQENEKLLKAKPEWRDPKLRRQALIAGQKLLADIGYTQQEIDSVMDHRILLIVDLAVKGKRLTAAPAAKAVTELRKSGLKRPALGLRGQARRDTEGPTSQTKARAQARASLKKSGDLRTAARLIEDMI